MERMLNKAEAAISLRGQMEDAERHVTDLEQALQPPRKSVAQPRSSIVHVSAGSDLIREQSVPVDLGMSLKFAAVQGGHEPQSTNFSPASSSTVLPPLESLSHYAGPQAQGQQHSRAGHDSRRVRPTTALLFPTQLSTEHAAPHTYSRDLSLSRNLESSSMPWELPAFNNSQVTAALPNSKALGLSFSYVSKMF